MEKGVRKTRNRNFREVELLVWLIILLISIILFSFLRSKSLQSYEIHNIFLPDVDGIIVGSPVNLMGIPIGYVNKVSIIGEDEVLVKFIVKDKSVKLDKGTIANIEANGLAGSRAIDLYPPNKEYVQLYGLDGNDYIVAKTPTRIRDAWSLLYEMYNTFTSMFYKVSNFNNMLKEDNVGTERKEATKGAKKFLEFFGCWVDNMQKDIKGIKVSK